jgi:predicted ArsR family transcriptional regulator
LPKKIYTITSRRQVEALASPVRLAIVDRLIAQGPLSVRALASLLGRAPTSVYQHLVVLQKLGLVRTAEIRVGRGRPAAVYQTTAPLIRLAPTFANRSAMTKMSRAIGGQSARDYAKGFKSHRARREGIERNHWLFRLYTSPSPEKLARINRLLDKLIEVIRTPDPDPGRLISVAWFMSPIGDARRGSKRSKARPAIRAESR